MLNVQMPVQAQTPAAGLPVAKQSPLIVPSPILSPVKEPGPVDTANPSSELRLTPASYNSLSTVSRSLSECVTSMLKLY